MPKKWTEDDEEYLRRHFRSMTNRELGKFFGVTPKSIETKLRRMRLKRREAPTIQVKEVVETHKPEPRAVAIKIFDKAVRLYADGEKKQAKQHFQKILNKYDDVIDVARAAREYIQELSKKTVRHKA
jgi:TolA-binding protein